MHEKMAESLTVDELEVLYALDELKASPSSPELCLLLTEAETKRGIMGNHEAFRRMIKEKDEDEDEYGMSRVHIVQNEEVVNEEQQKKRKVDEMEKKVSSKTKKKNKRKKVEIDDSEETLTDMINWKNNTPDYPPGRIIFSDPDMIGECSKPMRKQVMVSDVDGSLLGLMLGKDPVKKMMADGHVENPGKIGLEVSVYGPDGKINKMVFKMWNVDTPVLTSSGWMEFVRKYKLEPLYNFLTVWMFKHKKTHQICFAIDSTRFGVRGVLSGRILKIAF